VTGEGAPPLPWLLVVRGEAVVSVHAVDAARARRLVPRELTPLPLWPGRVAGGIWLAEYGPGSVLRYRELMAGCAVLWRGRPAVWVAHVYVDSRASLRGGREQLGVPKQMARFGERPGGWVDVVGEAGPVCSLQLRRSLPLWRQSLKLPALHLDARDPSGATACAHGNRIRGRVGVGRVEVEIPSGSPLRSLGLGPALVGLYGTRVVALLGGAPFLPPVRLPVTPPGPAPRD
jgi:acetoacetate decarboxylase